MRRQESELFFQANGITNEAKRKVTLLVIIGLSACKLFRSLVSPAKPDEKSYEELVEEMEKHHNPTPSEIVQRYKFNSCFSKESESIATYLSELRSTAQHCSFHDNLDNMLQDHLMCGMENKSIQKRLLSEAKLTLKKGTEIALAMETAKKNAETLQNADSPGSAKCEWRNLVHKLHLSERGRQSGEKLSGLVIDADKNRTMLPVVHTKNQSATIVVKWDT